MTEPDPQDPRNDTETPEEYDFMPNVWQAKFHGTCVNCPSKVYPGDEVVWIGDPEDRVIAHAVCPDPEAVDLTAAHGVCDDCHQALPASKICGWC